MFIQFNRWVVLLLLSILLSSSPGYAIGPYSTGSGTVNDNGTGLEWQNNASANVLTWQDALAYCEALSFDDKTDWRVPNIRELKSLVDYKRYYPAVDPLVLSKSSGYWSSTTVVANDAHTSAWVIFFGNGDDIWKGKTESHHVRCVRATLSKQ